MITSLILYVFSGFFQFFLSLLAGAVLAVGFQTQLQNFFQYVYQFNELFPIDTAFIILNYTVKFWLLVFAWQVLKFLIHLIRGN